MWACSNASHGLQYFDFRSAKTAFGSGYEFAGACERALSSAQKFSKLYDAILIDEAQDFPPAFLSHLTLGQYENCRVPVTAPLTPYWFVAFVLRNFYHTAFTCYAQDLPLFDNDFEETIDPTERSVIHVQVPLRRG